MMSEQAALQLAVEVGQRLAKELVGTPTQEQVFAAVDKCLTALTTSCLWGQANRLPSAGLWEAAGKWLQHGALLHRARFKPRGYAGDDEMLRQICEDWRCTHPMGRHLDAYFQSHAAPNAVRNRTRLVADAIVDAVSESPSTTPLRFISVGSGPGLDVAWAAARLTTAERERLKVSLYDLDPRALEGATARLAGTLTTEDIHAVRANLYRLPKSHQAIEASSAELVACTGFFDYLSDADAVALLQLLWQSLRPGGRLLVFNFAPHNPSRALMEWIGNWYLVYRDETAMETLARSAGITPDEYKIKAEAEGVDLYIDARRPN